MDQVWTSDALAMGVAFAVGIVTILLVFWQRASSASKPVLLVRRAVLECDNNSLRMVVADVDVKRALVGDFCFAW